MTNEVISFQTPLFVSLSKYVKGNSRLTLLINPNDYQTTFKKSDDILLPVINDTEFYVNHNDNLLSILDNNSYQSRLPISYQIKSFGLDNGLIFVYQSFVDSTDKSVRHNVLKSDFAVLDFLEANGISTKIEYIENAEYNKNFKKLPKLNICIYGFFLVAELIMQATTHNYKSDFYAQLRKTIADKHIVMKKRVRTSNGYNDKHFMNFMVSLNDNPYRLALTFIDLAGMHGNASLKSVMKNVGLSIETKTSLDDWKEKMHLAYFEMPEIFDEYGLGDLNIDEILVKYDSLWNSIYNDLSISHYKEPSLTIGSSVGNVIYSKLLERTQLDKETLEPLLFSANSDRLQHAVSFTSVYLSKVYGGLCRNNNPLVINENGILIDIDIDGAYANSMMQQEFPIGIPLVVDYPRNKKLSCMKTLREFLKEYRHELIAGLWIAIVETKEELSFEQDFILSWFNLSQVKTTNLMNENKEYVKNGNLILQNGKIQTKTGNVRILTKQISNGVINQDYLEYLDNLCSSHEKNELLDKLIVKTAMIYPLSGKCNSIDELLSKTNSWIEEFNETTSDMQNSVYQKIPANSAWLSYNIGDLITKQITQKRKQYDKSNPLNNLYKLINNTSYGDMVSEYFIFSNVCVANNITARVRAMAWYVMKGLNTRQIITDGGVFNINQVVYSNRDINQSRLTRLYANKKPWLEHLAIRALGNYSKIEKIETDNLIELYGYKDNNKELISSGNRFEYAPKEYEYKANGECTIAKLALEHLTNLFPNISVISQFKLAIKDIYDSACFHGAANYLLQNSKCEVSKMRAYEKKSKQWAIEYKDDNLALTDYYKELTPAISFLHSLKNPDRVKRSVSFIKPQLLTPGLFANNKRYWLDKTNLNCGDDFYKAQLIREFSLSQFTYQTITQINNVMAYERRFKDTRGQSYESFFTDKDNGILFYRKMIEVLDDCIRARINPYNVLNKERHLTREFNKGIHPNIDTLDAIKALIRSDNIKSDSEFDFSTYDDYEFDIED